MLDRSGQRPNRQTTTRVVDGQVPPRTLLLFLRVASAGPALFGPLRTWCLGPPVETITLSVVGILSVDPVGLSVLARACNESSEDVASVIPPEVTGQSCQATVAAVTRMNAAIASARSVMAARLMEVADKASMAAASYTDQDAASSDRLEGLWL